MVVFCESQPCPFDGPVLGLVDKAKLGCVVRQSVREPRGAHVAERRAVSFRAVFGLWLARGAVRFRPSSGSRRRKRGSIWRCLGSSRPGRARVASSLGPTVVSRGGPRCRRDFGQYWSLGEPRPRFCGCSSAQNERAVHFGFSTSLRQTRGGLLRTSSGLDSGSAQPISGSARLRSRFLVCLASASLGLESANVWSRRDHVMARFDQTRALLD